ncbi:signal peptidase I [bacterium]|nr:signal peptidase I [bacterium]RQV94432.1 MAG: signal peptidase I [bacterium]
MENGLKPYNKWIIYLFVIIISLAVDYSVSNAVRENIIKPFRIPTGSMEPTLLNGDFLLSNQLYYRTTNPARGEVVIMKYPEDERINYIKRIVGMPGDTLEIRDKVLIINGRPVAEPYIKIIDPNVQQRSLDRDYYGPVIVPSDEYFVLGDYRDNSLDSRDWGTVKRHQIIGKPIFIYWSWNGNIPAWNVFGKLASIRIGRMGHIIQ